MEKKETFTDLPSAPPPCGSKPYRILLVDDEKAVRDLHLELLTSAGYEVMAAADGALAWDAIQTQHFDLMITDNSMPKVSGVELINKLIDANIRLPIIIATGAAPQHELKRHPRLWKDPGTSDRDRKRMARLIFEDVTSNREHSQVIAQLRFKGGATKVLRISCRPEHGNCARPNPRSSLKNIP